MMAALQELGRDYLNRVHPLTTGVIGWDHTMFQHINQDWANPLFDQLMPFITDYHNTIYLLLAVVLFIILKAKMRSVLVILGCVIAVGIADASSSQIIKPWVHRSRPQFTMPHVRLLVPTQGSPSFPSNHAANCFAAATFMGLFVLGTGPVALAAAALVAYSRVYVGVHFPLDVLGGALVGFLSGLLVFKLFQVFGDVMAPRRLRTLPRKWQKKNYLNRHT